ncbi:copper resistance protein NlpE N-terminal domain-containing protein [Lonsdalea quercina]|uniref:copper resistance protein NlpE N-terminal domain-containing protein n=1 Tax=Lonsdalea quercina TaxID=71657 RepID=UPI0039763161
MMHKLIISSVLMFGLSGLIGCHSHPTVQSESLQPMAQHYRGSLPDSRTIALYLDADGSFVLNTHVVNSEGRPLRRLEKGQWQRTADKLVLTNTHGAKRYFLAKNNDLTVLDDNGRPLRSSQQYRLFAVNPA